MPHEPAPTQIGIGETPKACEINDSIQKMSEFLGNQRKSRVQSTYDYLEQAYLALRAGELSGGVRNELESCERDLLEIQRHIAKEYRQQVDKKVEMREMFGTGDLTEDITRKIDTLDQLAEEASLCLKTRIAAWHVLSLYPGKPQLKAARRSTIQESLESASQRDLEFICLGYEKGDTKGDRLSLSPF